MILFFYGADTYRLKQKVKELKQKYIDASLGDTNLTTIDGKTATYPEMVRQILAMPFLAKSRLVIIENLLLGKKASSKTSAAPTKGGEVQELIGEFLPKVPDNTFLVFLEEGVPDKRTSLFKKLSKQKTQEFKPLEGIQLNKWIKDEVQSRGGEIESGAIDKLIEYVGGDLWRMANEIDKLTAYSSQLTAENVELFVKPQVESNVFNLVDAMAGKSLKTALKELHFLLENGENELYCLSMIVYQYRNLLIIKDLLERSGGRLNQWDLAKQAGIHPYVAQKSLAQARAFTLPELKAIYKMLLDFDLKMKTGRLSPATGLDLLVAKLCV